jgi:hypothetical protein
MESATNAVQEKEIDNGSKQARTTNLDPYQPNTHEINEQATNFTNVFMRRAQKLAPGGVSQDPLHYNSYFLKLIS